MANSQTETQRIGRYKIISKLGHGLYGTVYLAYDPALQRNVAIKVIHRDYKNALDNVPPMEARIVGNLKHPNIIQIYDFGYFSNIPYLVFEYVEGKTLKQMLKNNKSLSFEETKSLAKPLIDAMTYAHRHGVVHLDLGPGNILIDKNGHPMIMDFGLSKVTNAQQSGVGITNLEGTLSYMSPEHFNRQTLGTYTDVFALGAILYRVITGMAPCRGDNFEMIVHNLIQNDIDYSFAANSYTGGLFKHFLMGALEKNITKRYADAGQMQEAFNDLCDIWSENKTQGLRHDASDDHSTVQFLLRRMKRKKDFPSITRTLTEINRLTSWQVNSSANKLANIILKDFALTNKLLKHVNSAYYPNQEKNITSISRAVVILGDDQVRRIANSLTFFSQLNGNSASHLLRDSMIKSFLSGLLARHLATRLKQCDKEEAFICGLFQSLGENMVIYYFPEDYEEITNIVHSSSQNKYFASREILGVDYAELGYAIAKIWKLSDPITNTILDAKKEKPDLLTNSFSIMSILSTFANQLCDIVECHDPLLQESRFQSLLESYKPTIRITEEFAVKLLMAGKEKLLEQESILEINFDKSRFCQKLCNWIENKLAIPEEEITTEVEAVSSH